MFQSRSTDKFEFTLEVILWVLLGVILIIPLLVIDKFYYPFIFTKALVFRVSVGLLFLVYLLLAVKSKKYRPKLNGLTIIFTLFLLSSFISSVFGINFYRSFWSNMERQEGLFLLLPLSPFFPPITTFFP